METNVSCQPFQRRLYGWEQVEIFKIFGPRLNYDAVRVHECTRWPTQLDQWSRKLRRLPARESHNAVTLGNHVIFPVRLPEHLPPLNHPERYKLGWLIHEITHVYQFQLLGWSYLLRALTVQIREKDHAYHFGSAEGLKARRKEGWTFSKFNLEAQGDIARSYYERLNVGEDVSDWEPYIRDIQEV